MKKEFSVPTYLHQLISAEQAYYYRIIPIDNNEHQITFITDRPENSLLQELKIIFNKEVILNTESETTINKFLSVNFRNLNTIQAKDLNYSNDFLEKLLLTAKEFGSSDIHFEPYESKCRIRFRIDGKLKEQFVLASEDYPVIVNKLKIKAGLDISEKRLPQDGRIAFKTNNNDFDIRISSLPILNGEKLVLRILNKDANHINLSELGLTAVALKTYKETLKKPNGIILISGPTGSGKTTTLYATLKLLNNENTNILTVEDPIEYTLEGINQVQLKENIGLDFASALRTFLRQDPDVIMVGEIRDGKTANMAIRAALTGHLVLSTIHTNSAWATISRLVDMKIPSFLIASTLNISIAQRLVRKLCKACKEKIDIKEAYLPKSFKIPENLKYSFRAVGCNNCHHTGYHGRVAIYEIIPITKVLIEHIKRNDLEIDDYIAKNNIETLKSNATKLLELGDTSIDEVYSILSS